MSLKLVLFFTVWMSVLQQSPDLETVRQDYRGAAENEPAVEKLFIKLMAIGKNGDATLVAYKGAVTIMMAKYAQGISDKKTFFKEGRDLLEYAIETEPMNVEIRCIRLSVQENVPKITGYHKNKDEDKQIILDTYSSMKDSGAKDFVKGYALASDSFTQTEKQLF